MAPAEPLAPNRMPRAGASSAAVRAGLPMTLAPYSDGVPYDAAATRGDTGPIPQPGNTTGGGTLGTALKLRTTVLYD